MSLYPFQHWDTVKCVCVCTSFSSESFLHHHSSLLQLSLFLLHLLQLSLDHLKSKTHKISQFSRSPGPHLNLSSGKFTWALWSLFNCSCLACLWAALCTRLVIWVSRSSSSSSCPPWNRVSLTLRLEGSFGWTRTPKTSVGQEDCPSESWRGSFTERLWDTTHNSVSRWQTLTGLYTARLELKLSIGGDQTTTIFLSDHNTCLYLDGICSSESQSMRNIRRLRHMKKKNNETDSTWKYKGES